MADDRPRTHVRLRYEGAARPSLILDAGSLNVLSTRPYVMDSDGDRHRMMMFAAAASALLEDAQRMLELRSTASQLREAMASRAPIEQAKGIIMASMRCTPDEAFERLVKLSQRRNVKLRQLAVDIVAASSRAGPADAPRTGRSAATAERAARPELQRGPPRQPAPSTGSRPARSREPRG